MLVVTVENQVAMRSFISDAVPLNHHFDVDLKFLTPQIVEGQGVGRSKSSDVK